MNPFETLPDDAMLHIFSFLPGKDLLTLSTMDRKFNRVITKTKETKDKTPMVINFTKKGLKLGDAIKAAQSRGFTALKLIRVSEYKSKTLQFTKMLKLLGGTVQDLAIESSKLKEEKFQSIIKMFLPKLKKCKLDSVKCMGNEESPNVSSHSGSNRPLEVLEIINTGDKVFDLFAGCSGLKSFKYHNSDDENNQQLNDFLALQTRLEDLNCGYDRLDLGRINFLQLKVLTTCFENEAKAVEFGKLPSLKILEVKASPANLRRVIESIHSAPKLEELRIQASRSDGGQQKLQLEGILNHNIKKLTIHGRIDVTAQLLEVFCGVESICLLQNKHLTPRTLDLSDMPFETIKKIDIMCCEGPDDPQLLSVRFSPEQVPANLEGFTSTVMNFAKDFPGSIGSITIGHENWRNNEDFSLPNSFCEDLVHVLPKLIHLELFNVADRGNFVRFLEANQHNLEDVKLIKPLSDGEPEPKMMKIVI